jgi:hypothetical protein
MNLSSFTIVFYTKKGNYMPILLPRIRIRILDPDPVLKKSGSGSDQKMRIRIHNTDIVKITDRTISIKKPLNLAGTVKFLFIF